MMYSNPSEVHVILSLRSSDLNSQTSGPQSARGCESSIPRLYTRLAFVFDAWATLTEERAQAQALHLADVRPGERVLDVAAGTGRLLAHLAALAPDAQWAGTDLSVGMMGRAQKQLISENRPSPPLCRADARGLPFPAETFDVVFNCYMLDLLTEDDIPIVLREFDRVLKRTGRLALLSMARQAILVNAVWMALYRCSPLLVGGCRPVSAATYLSAGGWRIDAHEVVRQFGNRSDVIVARPAGGSSCDRHHPLIPSLV